MHIATVKQVVSGDSFVLMGTPKGGPPPEKHLHLSSLIAPRVAMKSLSKETEDEPYAWTSREFMREKLLGKDVEFKVEYTQGDREYGWMKLKGEIVALALVKKGLARVKSNRNPPCAGDIEELIAAENAAKEAKVGIWNDEPGAGLATVRQIQWSANNQSFAKKLFEENKNKKLKGIVEYVRDAGYLRVMFTDQWIYAPVLISGIACDGFKREQKEGAEDYSLVPEPFAVEAKFFVESRLLNRDVEIRLEGAEDNGDLYGSVFHPQGNIALFLLKSGLAKIQEWSARLTESPAQMREAMKEAQSNRLRKWKNWEPLVLEGEKEYTARVSEILSGDCLMLQLGSSSSSSSSADASTGERRVYLASVRCPRVGNRVKADEPWGFEAKEFCRKHLIQKKVKVVLEYIREPIPSSTGAPPPPGSDSQGRMHYVTVTTVEGEKASINELLITNGLAKTAPHRADDDRAENFDVLLELEKTAEGKGVGLFGPERNAPKNRINDLLGSANSVRARAFEAQLTRPARLEGVVEHIFNGGKFKLRIPSEDLSISFTLGGIRCPQTARAGGAGSGPIRSGEPFAVEALRHSKEQLQQRDVSVKIQQVDKGGNFIGTLWNGKTNFATEMLELGFACTMEFSLHLSPYKEEYVAAEQKAKAAKINVWSVAGAIEKHSGASLNGDDDKGEREVDESLPVVVVSHINSILDFFIQEGGGTHGIINAITKLLSEYKEQDQVESQYTAAGAPRKGDVVIARFSLDDKWYRARVDSRDTSTGEFQIVYIDFGNSESVQMSKLRRCPAYLTTSAHAPAAKHCALSGLLQPPDMEHEAAQYFHDLTEGKLFKCQVEKVDAQRKRLVVITEQEAATTPGANSINELIMRNGLGRLDKKSTTKSFNRLRKEEEAARKQHVNVWRYGDVGDDDDADADFPSLTNGRASANAKRR